MALAPTASLAGSEPRQPLPQETMIAGQLMLQCDSVRPKGKGSDQKRRYVGGDATGLNGCATRALENYNAEEDAVAHTEEEVDKKHSPTWHCSVGRNFGSYRTHESKHLICFYLGRVAILLFKSS